MLLDKNDVLNSIEPIEIKIMGKKVKKIQIDKKISIDTVINVSEDLKTTAQSGKTENSQKV